MAHVLAEQVPGGVTVRVYGHVHDSRVDVQLNVDDAQFLRVEPDAHLVVAVRLAGGRPDGGGKLVGHRLRVGYRAWAAGQRAWRGCRGRPRCRGAGQGADDRAPTGQGAAGAARVGALHPGRRLGRGGTRGPACTAAGAPGPDVASTGAASPGVPTVGAASLAGTWCRRTLYRCPWRSWCPGRGRPWAERASRSGAANRSGAGAVGGWLGPCKWGLRASTVCCGNRASGSASAWGRGVTSGRQSGGVLGPTWRQSAVATGERASGGGPGTGAGLG